MKRAGKNFDMQSDSRQYVVVLSFERLPIRLLGFMGDSQIATPNFDRIAAEAVVFDQHYVENPSLLFPDHTWWTGNFSTIPKDIQTELPLHNLDSGHFCSSSNLIESLRAKSVRTILIRESNCQMEVPPFEIEEKVAALRECMASDSVDHIEETKTSSPSTINRMVAHVDQFLDEGSESTLLWGLLEGIPECDGDAVDVVEERAIVELIDREIGILCDAIQDSPVRDKPCFSLLLLQKGH